MLTWPDASSHEAWAQVPSRCAPPSRLCARSLLRVHEPGTSLVRQASTLDNVGSYITQSK
jgi:hypothetical protein